MYYTSKLDDDDDNNSDHYYCDNCDDDDSGNSSDNHHHCRHHRLSFWPFPLKENGRVPSFSRKPPGNFYTPICVARAASIFVFQIWFSDFLLTVLDCCNDICCSQFCSSILVMYMIHHTLSVFGITFLIYFPDVLAIARHSVLFLSGCLSRAVLP
jgi:hypothetical protein